MDELIVLTYLKDHLFINTDDAVTLLQLNRDMVFDVLNKMSHPKRGILERKGHTKTATYYLAKPIAKDLIGKAAYSRSKGIDQKFPVCRKFLFHYDRYFDDEIWIFDDFFTNSPNFIRKTLNIRKITAGKNKNKK